MDQDGQHAVVLGGSIAGLLAARALTDRYDRVTVVERDHLSSVDGHRRGVPQSRQVHVLLPRGQQAMEELLPGVTDEMVEAGATIGTTLDIAFCFSGHRLCPVDAGLTAVHASRVLLERGIRARVLGLPEVEVMDGWQAAGVLGTRDAVTGVELRQADGSGETRELDADLVVDATGRGSRTPVWLDALGLPRAEEDEVAADVVYTTMEFPRRATDPFEEIVVGPAAPAVRGGAAVAIEGGRWIVTLAGRGDEHAPTDPAGFVAYARTLPIPDIHAVVADREPLTDAEQFRYRANRRRRYDRLERLPEGLLVVGDALCSFNPIYGQGMSMAAVGALALQRCLADGTTGLARRFFAAVRPDLDVAWDMAVMADAQFSGTGVTRTLKDRIVSAYLDRVMAAAGRDPVVATALLRTITMVDTPESLLHPRIAGRVLAASVRPARPADRAAPVPTAT